MTATVAELDRQALSIAQSFLELNYPCECVADPECPGEVHEAQYLIERLRPVFHREKDALDYQQFAQRFAKRFPGFEAMPVGGTVEDYIFDNIERAVHAKVAARG